MTDTRPAHPGHLMVKTSYFARARSSFHADLLRSVLRTDESGVPSNADKHSKPSVKIAQGILGRLGPSARGDPLAGQTLGSQFEEICEQYMKKTFLKLGHLRPGNWGVGRGIGHFGIARFDQYEHLAALDEAARASKELAAALGTDYLIRPDVVIFRYPEDDGTINSPQRLVDEAHARLTSLRKVNQPRPILHASISCKWTLRSDRAQNARSEALNLVRNRKGHLPHVVVVTGEPTPARIASIALGTGDIDCVYHFALTELVETVRDLKYEDAGETLETMIRGKRLRDIADLPLDLVQ